MFKRVVKLSNSHSFFLFGARGTGKTTLLRDHFNGEDCLWIDLLDPVVLDRLAARPVTLKEFIQAKENIQTLVIDEVQRLPALLDIVHSMSFEMPHLQFILTGSSARKLKRNQANLLAGRAFKYFCHPLTVDELKRDFDLFEVLQFGSLPKIFSLSQNDKCDFLRAYVENYFKEEIVAEQIVRNLRPFKNFLTVAAQSNGQLLNMNKIARDVDIDHSTVQNYFEILEETLVGFLVEPYHQSVRKRQRTALKFYYFDLGVCRTLRKLIEIPLTPESEHFGNAFEHFCILEIKRKIDYQKPDWSLSYLRTKDGVEIDLVIERPGQKLALIEFKSTENIQTLSTMKLNNFAKITSEFKNAETFIISRDPMEKRIDHILFLPWWKMFEALFI